MGGFFGVAAKEDCVFDLAWIIIRIWAQDAVAWQSGEKKALTVRSTI